MEYIRNKRSKISASVVSHVPVTISVKPIQASVTVVETKPKSEVELKKEARRIRNRESAEASRKRRRDDALELRSEIEKYKRQISLLKSRLAMHEPLDAIEYMLQNDLSDGEEMETIVYREPAVFFIHPCL